MGFNSVFKGLIKLIVARLVGTRVFLDILTVVRNKHMAN
jgi:hypothetical protein